MEWWALGQTIVYVAGLIGLGVYQHRKILGLKDQIQSQNEILNNAQKLMNMHNPEF